MSTLDSSIRLTSLSHGGGCGCNSLVQHEPQMNVGEIVIREQCRDV